MKAPLVVVISIVVCILGLLLVYSLQHDQGLAQANHGAAGHGSAPAAGGYGSAAPAAGGYGAAAPAAGGYGAPAPAAGGYGAPGPGSRRLRCTCPGSRRLRSAGSRSRRLRSTGSQRTQIVYFSLTGYNRSGASMQNPEKSLLVSPIRIGTKIISQVSLKNIFIS